MARGRKPKHQGPPNQKGVRPSAERYSIDMLLGAEEVYIDLYKKAKDAEKRGDYTSSHCTTLRMIQEAIKDFIPQNPLNPKYALSGELANIFRIKKGRFRICWIASSKLKRICVLYISENLRKEGDINDPYRVFAQMVMSGKFNDVFGQLGVRMPHLRINPGEKPH